VISSLAVAPAEVVALPGNTEKTMRKHSPDGFNFLIIIPKPSRYY
jgi:hypothetical protein